MDTDLEKALAYDPVEDVRRHGDDPSTIVLGGMGGSLSHVLANLGVLYRDRLPSSTMVFMDDENIALVIRPQFRYVIRSMFKMYCSLIPLGHPVESVSTSGLNWNLTGESLDYSKLVSTSNYNVSSKIVIETSHPLLWVVDSRNH